MHIFGGRAFILGLLPCAGFTRMAYFYDPPKEEVELLVCPMVDPKN